MFLSTVGLPLALPLLCAAHFLSEDALNGPFTRDFIKFLNKNKERNSVLLSALDEYGASGSFGGRIGDEAVQRQPVIFVHGNSDSALFHSAPFSTGWSKQVEYFKKKGYNNAELYGIAYGDRNITNSINNEIGCSSLKKVRFLIDAVLAYTTAEKVDIVAHSMGVTLVRKAIQGGMVLHHHETCHLGPPLVGKVDALVAISGANLGMCFCLLPTIANAKACNPLTGFYPGHAGEKRSTYEQCSNALASATEHTKKEHSAILQSLDTGVKEADFIASLWSKDDKILGANNLVWGRPTSYVPKTDLVIEVHELDHMPTKDDTVEEQFALVTQHQRFVSKRARRTLHSDKYHLARH